MPRINKRKTTKGLTPPEVMRKAVNEVIGGASENSVAQKYNISRETLRRLVMNWKSQLNIYLSD